MPLGMEVGLVLRDFVLDGELGTQLSPPLKGAQSPIFDPCLMWPTVAHLSYC